MADAGCSDASRNAWKLFHSVVVLGAALGSATSGCGQAAGRETDNSGGQAGSNVGAAGQAGASGGQSASGGVISISLDPTPGPRSCDYAGSQRGTAESPLGPADCPAPEQFSCRSGASGATECVCDPEAPLTPEACVTTSQFQCVVFAPVRACCQCDASAPTDASGCSGRWQCYSYEPPVGCQCVVVIL